jgi:hypothetical protein
MFKGVMACFLFWTKAISHRKGMMINTRLRLGDGKSKKGDINTSITHCQSTNNFRNPFIML